MPFWTVRLSTVFSAPIFCVMLTWERLIHLWAVFVFLRFSCCNLPWALRVPSKAWVFPLSFPATLPFSWPSLSFSQSWDGFIYRLWQKGLLSPCSSSFSWPLVFFICRFWPRCKQWSFTGFFCPFWGTILPGVRSTTARICPSRCRLSKCGWFWWNSLTAQSSQHRDLAPPNSQV